MTHTDNPRDEAVLTAAFGAFPKGLLAHVAWRLATARKFSPQLRNWFRKRLARKFPGPFDVIAEEVSIRAWPAENRCDRIAVGRGVLPESSERRLIEPILTPDMVFVDIGANVGVYTLFVSQKTQRRARVLALEPHPRTYAKLTCNCRLNGLDNVVALNVAAGLEEGRAELFSDGGGNIGGASLLVEASGCKRSFAVKTAPLPKLLEAQSIDRIDLLKVDIEGFEDRALLPLLSDQSLKNLWPRSILIETVHQNLWQDDLLVILEASGYAVAGETAENLLLTR